MVIIPLGTSKSRKNKSYKTFISFNGSIYEHFFEFAKELLCTSSKIVLN